MRPTEAGSVRLTVRRTVVIQMQRLVVPYPTMRGTERLRLGSCLEPSATVPDGMGCVERVIFSFGAFEKVKCYKARHLGPMSAPSQKHRLRDTRVMSGLPGIIIVTKQRTSGDNSNVPAAINVMLAPPPEWN